MRSKHLGILAISVFVTLMTWSCEGYLDQFSTDRLSTRVELTPSVAMPVAYGSFSIQDILESLNDSAGLVSLTEDSLIYIFFRDTAFTFYANEIVDIPDHVGSETYIQSDINITQWVDLPIGDHYIFHKTEQMNFEIEQGDRIDSVIIKSGFLNLKAFSEFKHAGILTVTSSNIYDPQGDSLDLTFTISDTLGLFSNTDIYPLDGYKMTVEEVDDSAKVIVHLSLDLTKSHAGIAVDERAGIRMTFTNLEFQSIFGKISKRDVTDVDEQIDIEFFDNIVEVPEFYLADPQFNIGVHNSFGIPLSIEITDFTARSHRDGSLLDLQFYNDTMNPFTIVAPTVEQIGQTITRWRKFNKSTCNIADLISSVPDRIDFSISATTGSDSLSTEQNFLLDTSKVVLEAEVYLPLWLSTKGYTLKDTLDFAFDSLMADLDFIDRIHLRLRTTNEWPLEVLWQLYFMDNNYVAVDSLFEGEVPLIEAAPVNAEGEVDETALEMYELNVEMDHDRLQKVKDATMLMLVATARTSGDGVPTVKFYSHYMLDYQLSVSADFKITDAMFNSEE